MADDDLDLDLDDLPEGGRSRGGGPGAPTGGSGQGRRTRWVWLLIGVALGVAAAILVPRYVAPHLPASLGGGLVTVEGEVLEKQRESGRLLLTLDSDRGAMLATFRDRVSELDLLVGSGDTVTLAMAEFRPFVEGPRLVGVKKGAWKGRVPAARDDDTAGAGPDTAAPPAGGDARPGDRGPRTDADTAPPDGGSDTVGPTRPDTVPPDTAGAPR